MSTIKTYTVVFRNSGTPETGLAPTLGLFVDVDTGTPLTEPAIVELGAGVYKFTMNWADVDYDDVNQIALQVDAGAGSGLTDDDRYVFGSIQRRDELDIYTLTDAMVMGNWQIDTNQLKVYASADTITPIATFNLTDINGDPTSTSATSRTAV